MTPVQLQAEYLYGTFQRDPNADYLEALVEDYHRTCEAYDRTVCTGPMGLDGILPANPREMGLIQRHAGSAHRNLVARAAAAGFVREELSQAMRRFDHRGLP